MKKVIIWIIILCVGYAVYDEYFDNDYSPPANIVTDYTNNNFTGDSGNQYYNNGYNYGGYTNPSTTSRCTRCFGKGVVDCTKCVYGECHTCDGSGIYRYLGNSNICSTCRGSGLCNKCNGAKNIKCTYCY